MVTRDMMSQDSFVTHCLSFRMILKLRLFKSLQEAKRDVTTAENRNTQKTQEKEKTKSELTFVLSSTTLSPSAETHNTALTVFFPL